MSALAVKALFLGTRCWFGRLALFDGHRHAFNESLKSFYSRLFIFFLMAVLLGLDNNDAVLGDASIIKFQKPLFVKSGQRGGQNVKAQVYSRRNLINVLTAGSLGANRTYLDIAQGNSYIIRNLDIVYICLVLQSHTSPLRLATYTTLNVRSQACWGIGWCAHT